MDVNARGSESFSSSVFNLYNKQQSFVVLSHPMGEEFDDISSKKLRNYYQKRFLNFTNLYFSGLHPDITYLGGMGSRVETPMEDYHSRIILSSFVKGFTPDECKRLFTGPVYERLGYFKQFHVALAELGRRDQENDIKFAANFAEMTRSRLTMLSVNHPTLDTMVELAKAIEANFTDKASTLSTSICSYPLATGPIWPIYPEIREYHALPYGTSFDFHPRETRGNVLTLDEFILASYKSYDERGRDFFLSTDAGQSFANLPII